jgi:hypothetical protein
MNDKTKAPSENITGGFVVEASFKVCGDDRFVDQIYWVAGVFTSLTPANTAWIRRGKLFSYISSIA